MREDVTRVCVTFDCDSWLLAPGLLERTLKFCLAVQIST
jgi:hypothetical protein